MSGPAAVMNGASPKTLASLLEGGLFVDGDWIETKDQDPNGEVRLIQLADIGDGVFRDRSSRFLSMDKAKELRCTFLEPGDVLIARMPDPLGRACIFPGVGQPAVTAVDVCILRPSPDRVRPEWLVKGINSPGFRSSMQAFVRGTTRQRISRKNLGGLPMILPSVEAQLELASFIDRIEAKRISAEGHVTIARTATERFRQAILVAACSGHLTADWRRSHKNEPTGEDFVSKVDQARRERLGRKYKQLERLSGDEELPGSWCWAPIGACVDVATGATPLRKRPDYYGGPIAWVTSGSVNAGLITEASETITELALQETNTKVFPPGTLLVAMYGEGQTRGRVAELAIEAATNQAVAALLFDPVSEPLRPYLKLYLLRNYERIRLLSFGGVQPNLSLGVIRDTLVPIPPLDEQREIVRRADQLLRLAHGLTRRIDIASEQVERSSQAVLAKAFRGQLLAPAVDA